MKKLPRPTCEACGQPLPRGRGRPGLLITFNGETKTLGTWAKERGLKKTTLRARIATQGAEFALRKTRRAHAAGIAKK